MKMNKEQFMELMGITEEDDAMEAAQEAYEDSHSWFEVAKSMIASMNILLSEE